ncbi:MFS transporter, partial [Neisseria sp. P0019.S002]
FLLVLTIGELMISPIALSIATKIAPPMFKTQMVALNFLGFSVGFTLGGVLFKEGFNEKAPLDFYWMICGIGVITGLVLLLLVPILNKMLKGVD